jgi:pimeloyl-ACP methyl ester carboxylesterase
VTAAHTAGASLGGRIGQLLAVHHQDRVRTLTAIKTSPMGYEPGAAWARALARQPPEPGDLPAPTHEFLRHVTAMASSPPATSRERVSANVETWRILSGTTLPFDADARLSRKRVFQVVPGMGHGFFSPGIPAQVGRLILDHTARSA